MLSYFKNRKKRKAQAALAELRKALIDQLTKAELDPSAGVLGYLKVDGRVLSREERLRWYEAHERTMAYYYYPEQSRKLRNAVAIAQKASGASEEIEAWAAVAAIYKEAGHPEVLEKLRQDAGVSKDEVHAKLQSLVKSRYDALMSRRNNASDFRALMDLIYRNNGLKGSFSDCYWKLGLEALEYPEDWNDLVARHIRTPAIEMFVGQPERGPGDVRLLAAEAKRTNSLTQAQIVLAYCNRKTEQYRYGSEYAYRDAVGDVLMADMAELVDRQRLAAPADFTDGGS